MSLIDDRPSQILKALVERYIHDGAPVGSRRLLEDLATPVSSATVRSDMVMLEERGLLCSPHTSAGRIPTELGYRFFVDRLITMSPLTSESVDRVNHQLSSNQTPSELLERASKVLSDMTALAGVVVAPKQELSCLRQIDFLPLSDNRVLVILVLNEKEVQNRIIDMGREFSEAELQQMANYLNRRFSGEDLLKIKANVLQDMQDDKVEMNRHMQMAVEMAAKTFDGDDLEPECVVSGQSNLIQMAGAGGADQLQMLFESFQQKRDLLHLMDQCSRAEGIQVFIGKESGYQVFDECSMITAPYTDAQKNVLGMLAVIGPKRMAYQDVIPMVDMTAKMLSAALNPED
ncbi:heat-inducible transcriptional repressor HrcA [Gammaproteobacteria bacterium 45_16_T64]|nr:heat-inducible transcriptional repressor HrcA [Gammaproteobacteria bacterium 45_16_T64]